MRTEILERRDKNGSVYYDLYVNGQYVISDPDKLKLSTVEQKYIETRAKGFCS